MLHRPRGPALRKGLVAAENTDDTGNPTAACSPRSPAGARTERQRVVTWMGLDDQIATREMWDSQGRAIDGRQRRRQDLGVRVGLQRGSG